MSKINAIRLINVNYNNNAYRISDETMYFNGESTLLSLQNARRKIRTGADADSPICPSEISQYQGPSV